MPDSSGINKELIEENALLKKKIQELKELGSEHKQTKAALRESEEKYRSLIQKIQTAVVVHGPDTQILACNPMAQELLGLTESQMLGKTAIDKDWHFFNADGTVMSVEEYPVNKVIASRQPLRNLIAGVHRTNKNLENDVWVLINAIPVIVNDKITQVIVTFVDITDHKRAEEALRESERKYRNLYHHAQVGLFETGLKDAKIIACNQRYSDLAGFPTVDSAIGHDTLHLYANPSDREEVKKIIGAQGYIADHVLKLKNRLTGATFWAEFSARTNPSREIIEGTIIDITERKRAEKALQKAQKYINNIIDSMPSMLVGVDKGGRITQWNKTAEKNTGIAAMDAQGKTLSDVLPQMSLEMAKITESIRTREIKQERRRSCLSETESYYEDLTIYPLITNDVEGAVIRIDDITDKVRMEEMMIQSEKMLSVGGLAAGMAHEINNPLAGMVQTASIMADRLSDNIDIPANLKAAEKAGTTMESIQNFMAARGIPRMITTIDQSASRIASIVNNMLSFTRKADSSVSFHDIADLMDRALELAATDYDLKKQYDFKRIEIIKEYEDTLPSVPCEGAKIQQVLLNILRNGAQAMNEQRLKHTAAGVKAPPPRFVLRLAYEKEREMVSIDIEDNGPGMDEETRKRVFDPFFTTKPVGVGTGLGLSVSYFIVFENHGGEMAVKSIPGKGATFIIRLPAEGGG